MTQTRKLPAGIHKKILHHFRRNRKYHRHERWGVVASLLVLTVLVSAGGTLLATQTRTQAATAEVKAIAVSHEAIELTDDTAEVTIALVKAGTEVPAASTWVGLKPKNLSQVGDRYIYSNWYSPITSRAFFQTDARGEVAFPLLSENSGVVEYDIYVADPSFQDQSKLTRTGSSFEATFVE